MTNKVNPIPDGYHSINTFITVKEAEKAIVFYKNAFDAQEKSRFNMPDGRVMFAELQIGNSTFQLADEFPEYGKIASPHSLNGTSCIIHLYVEDADAVFDAAIRAGAKVKTKLEDMFWGDRYGQVEDPFGHIWSISTRIKNIPPDQLKEFLSQLVSQR